jgi:alpha-D-xyloside xylohydrolase
VLLEADGDDAIRVTIRPGPPSSPSPLRTQYPSALSGAANGNRSSRTSLVNGNLRASVQRDMLVFERVSDGQELLREQTPCVFAPSAHSGYYSADLDLMAYEGERLYGLGQHKTGKLDNKGETFSLRPVNTEILIPVVHSSRGYTFVWNLPSFGNVSFSNRSSHWHAEAAPFVSLWLCTTGSPVPKTSGGAVARSTASPWAERMYKFTAAVGRAPQFPPWVSGYWQSRNRYRNQSELLEVVRGFRRRQLPLQMIVIDYHTWDDPPNSSSSAAGSSSPSPPHHTFGSDYLNPQCWPDVPAMMAELAIEPRVEVMISPYYNFVGNHTSVFRAATAGGLLALDAQKQPAMGVGGATGMWDVFKPDAREAMMKGVTAGYVAPYKITNFWLDCDEPCQSDTPDQYAGMPASAVGAAYPDMLARATREALGDVAGSVMLGRSAWLGSQRWGVAVWSGDTDSSWRALQQQVRAGQNVALSGITYWTSDIGGYAGGGGGPRHLGFDHNIHSSNYLQLLTRWHQFGVMCPVFRSHGHRLPELPAVSCDGGASGGYNEVWHFAEPYRSAIVAVMQLRQSLRPLIEKLYALAASDGSPVIRMLPYEFPDDATASSIDDQFLLGDEYLVAPVIEPNVTQRSVYLPLLPSDERWQYHFNASAHRGLRGGRHIVVSTPLAQFPLFRRVRVHTP